MTLTPPLTRAIDSSQPVCSGQCRAVPLALALVTLRGPTRGMPMRVGVMCVGLVGAGGGLGREWAPRSVTAFVWGCVGRAIPRKALR